MSEQRSGGRERPSRTGAKASERDVDEEEVDTSHLDGIADGCGCAEMMDHLSEEREE